MCRDSRAQPGKVQYTVAGQVTSNYVEEHCYNHSPWCYRTDHCKIHGRRLVQDHGRLRSALGDPDPDPSGVAGHRRVHLDLDPDPVLVLVLGRGQGVEFPPSLGRVRVLRG